MINITNQIMQRLSNLGFETYDHNMNVAVSYFISQNLKEILGKDTYSDEDIEIMMSGKSISIEPNDFDRFSVSVQDDKIVAISDTLLFSIYKFGNKVISDRMVDNVIYRSVASEDECALMRYSDSNLDYDVRAKNIGAVKTGRQLYQLIQNTPKEENTSFLYKIHSVLSNKDVVSIKEDVFNKQQVNYDEIFSVLNTKYSHIINEGMAKTR